MKSPYQYDSSAPDMNRQPHKPGCMANMRCAVIHLDGICPGPYGKCTCDGIDNLADISKFPSPTPITQMTTKDYIEKKKGELETMCSMDKEYSPRLLPQTVSQLTSFLTTAIQEGMELARKEEKVLKDETRAFYYQKGYDEGMTDGKIHERTRIEKIVQEEMKDYEDSLGWNALSEVLSAIKENI